MRRSQTQDLLEAITRAERERDVLKALLVKACKVMRDNPYSLQHVEMVAEIDKRLKSL